MMSVAVILIPVCAPSAFSGPDLIAQLISMDVAMNPPIVLPLVTYALNPPLPL